MRKLFSGVFAVVGTILMAGTALLCLISLNATPKILEFPQEASHTIQTFAAALTQGDLTAAGQCIYGQPELAAETGWEDETKDAIWAAYVRCLSCAPAREPVATDEGIDWAVELTMLDTPALLDAWQQQTNALLALAGEEEGDQTQQALADGLTQTLAGELPTKTQQVTLHLIFRDDQWWVSPDASLLQTLSGQV